MTRAAATSAWDSGFVLASVALAVFTFAAFAWFVPWIKGRP